MSIGRAAVLLCLAALAGCATEKSAAPAAKSYTVTLTPSAEIPPCGFAGNGAQGKASLTVAPDDSSIGVTVSYSGLSGPPTAAHIHAGPVSATGPVVLPFSGDLSSPFSKTFTAADYVAAPGAPPDFASFVQGLRTGGAYLNVHTAACKPGEIRGQIL